MSCLMIKIYNSYSDTMGAIMYILPNTLGYINKDFGRETFGNVSLPISSLTSYESLFGKDFSRQNWLGISLLKTSIRLMLLRSLVKGDVTE